MIRSIVVSLFILLFLTSCSLFVRRDPAIELHLLRHLETWRNFRLDGIAEVTVSQFRLRKNVSVVKTEDSLNLTLFDTGIFGLRPTPFLSIEIDSLFSISLPEEIRRTLGGIPESDEINIGMINSLIDELEKNKMTIVRDRRISLKQAEIDFNENMQISTIKLTSDEGELLLDFLYRREDLNGIVLYVRETKFLEISVDRISYIN